MRLEDSEGEGHLLGVIAERDKRIAELEAALKEIAKVGYGIDGTETDEELGEYWADLAIRYRGIARKALRGDKPWA